MIDPEARRRRRLASGASPVWPVVGRYNLAKRVRLRARGAPDTHPLHRTMGMGPGHRSSRGQPFSEISLGAQPDTVFDALAEDDVEPNGRVPAVLVAHRGALPHQGTVPCQGPAERPKHVTTVEELS